MKSWLSLLALAGTATLIKADCSVVQNNPDSQTTINTNQINVPSVSTTFSSICDTFDSNVCAEDCDTNDPVYAVVNSWNQSGMVNFDPSSPNITCAAQCTLDTELDVAPVISGCDNFIGTITCTFNIFPGTDVDDPALSDNSTWSNTLTYTLTVVPIVCNPGDCGSNGNCTELQGCLCDQGYDGDYCENKLQQVGDIGNYGAGKFTYNNNAQVSFHSATLIAAIAWTIIVAIFCSL